MNAKHLKSGHTNPTAGDLSLQHIPAGHFALASALCGRKTCWGNSNETEADRLMVKQTIYSSLQIDYHADQRFSKYLIELWVKK